MFNQALQIHSTFADFFTQFGEVGAKYPCWVSHLDPNIAITELDLRRLKKEVMYSLVPLAVFILFTLYAFCRLGVFSICNPFRCCPTPADQAETATLTPKQLFRSWGLFLLHKLFFSLRVFLTYKKCSNVE